MSGFLTNTSSSERSVSIRLVDTTGLAAFDESSISHILMSSFMSPPCILLLRIGSPHLTDSL